MFTRVLLIIVKKTEQPRLSIDEWINKCGTFI